MTATQTRNSRNCNQCGAEYNARHGHGGGLAQAADLATFPHNGTTGVRAENPGWMHGAHCSEACYDAAYYEPPTTW